MTRENVSYFPPPLAVRELSTALQSDLKGLKFSEHLYLSNKGKFSDRHHILAGLQKALTKESRHWSGLQKEDLFRESI